MNYQTLVTRIRHIIPDASFSIGPDGTIFFQPQTNLRVDAESLPINDRAWRNGVWDAIVHHDEPMSGEIRFDTIEYEDFPDAQ